MWIVTSFSMIKWHVDESLIDRRKTCLHSVWFMIAACKWMPEVDTHRTQSVESNLEETAYFVSLHCTMYNCTYPLWVKHVQSCCKHDLDRISLRTSRHEDITFLVCSKQFFLFHNKHCQKSHGVQQLCQFHMLCRFRWNWQDTMPPTNRDQESMLTWSWLSTELVTT